MPARTSSKGHVPASRDHIGWSTGTFGRRERLLDGLVRCSYFGYAIYALSLPPEVMLLT